MKKVIIGIIIAIFLSMLGLISYHGWVYEKPKTFSYPIYARIDKDWYEVTEDDTVLIYCHYYLENSSDCTVSFQLEASFQSDHRTFFLKEETFVSDETYTLEPGERMSGHIVFEGHRWLASKMWDRNPPITTVVNMHSEILEYPTDIMEELA